MNKNTPKVWVCLLTAVLCIAGLAACTADPADLAPATQEVCEDTPHESPADRPETAQDAYEESPEVEDGSQDFGVTWEYTPLLSSNYPGFPFYVSNFFFTHLEATCSDGQLINRDTGTQGSSIICTPKEALFWTPTSDDSSNVPSATIQFTIYDEDTQLYHGTLLIEQISTDDGTATYSASLSDCSELMLQHIFGGPRGGALYRIPIHDLSEDGPVTRTTYQLRELHFTTNSTQIAADFSETDEPVEIQLYATDAEDPLFSFSSDSEALRSCSFSGLTASREYYLAVQCGARLSLTISDG